MPADPVRLTREGVPDPPRTVSSEDHRLCVWDLERVGETLSKDDAVDGPAELLVIPAPSPLLQSPPTATNTSTTLHKASSTPYFATHTLARRLLAQSAYPGFAINVYTHKTLLPASRHFNLWRCGCCAVCPRGAHGGGDGFLLGPQ